MVIEKLILKNFKCFKDSSFEFRDLTIIAGANSSGKSSIISAICAIMQTQNQYLFPFAFELNGEFQSLGSYKDVVYGSKTNLSINIGIIFREKKEKIEIDATYRYASRGNQILPEKINIIQKNQTLILEWSGAQNGYRIKTEGVRPISEKDKKNIEKIMKTMASIIEEADKEELGRKHIDRILARIKSGSPDWEKLESKKPRDIVREIDTDPAYFEFMQTLSYVKNEILDQFEYIGPIRTYPLRQYNERFSDRHLDPTGELAYQLIFNWKKHFPEKFKTFVNLLKDIELADDFDAKTIKGDLLEYKVTPYRHREKVNIVDVGFGISQIIPILVADIKLPKNGTLLVNQPEVHLHPSSQALLGNYFASRLDRRSYIIETHSEYLINRLRLLVAEGKLNKEKVKIIYVDTSNDQVAGPAVHDVYINKDGSLEGAPITFFNTYHIDTFNLAMTDF